MTSQLNPNTILTRWAPRAPVCSRFLFFYKAPVSQAGKNSNSYPSYTYICIPTNITRGRHLVVRLMMQWQYESLVFFLRLHRLFLEITGQMIKHPISSHGGIPTPLKMWKSVGVTIPNIWKNKIRVPNHQPVPYHPIYDDTMTKHLSI